MDENEYLAALAALDSIKTDFFQYFNKDGQFVKIRLSTISSFCDDVDNELVTIVTPTRTITFSKKENEIYHRALLLIFE